MCYLGRGHYEKHFGETVLNFGQWFRRRCYLKIVSIFSSVGHFGWPSRTFCAILVEGIW